VFKHNLYLEVCQNYSFADAKKINKILFFYQKHKVSELEDCNQNFVNPTRAMNLQGSHTFSKTFLNLYNKN